VLQAKLLAEPPHVEPTAFGIDMMLIELALVASPAVAEPALARLRTLTEARFFEVPNEALTVVLAAAEAVRKGRGAEAVGPLRPLATNLAFRSLLARLYDAAGAFELAARVDGSLLASGRSLHAGLQMTHVRAARRARSLGKPEEGRALARTIVEAWSLADDDVPLLAEMRALVG
jgi:eukaryotic-like serine/threonine-protein kinase